MGHVFRPGNYTFGYTSWNLADWIDGGGDYEQAVAVIWEQENRVQVLVCEKRPTWANLFQCWMALVLRVNH